MSFAISVRVICRLADVHAAAPKLWFSPVTPLEIARKYTETSFESNFSAYRGGGRYRYYGGHAERTPATLVPPRSGRWHVVADLGSYGGHVEASVAVC